MRTECAIICDAASVRDGLLNLLGGGITNIAFPGFPARLPVAFAFRVVLDTRELKDQHHLKLDLVNALRGDRVEASEEVVFQVGPEWKDFTEEAGIAAAIPLSIFQIDRPGKYLLRAWFDAHALGTFPLRVIESAAPAT